MDILAIVRCYDPVVPAEHAPPKHVPWINSFRVDTEGKRITMAMLHLETGRVMDLRTWAESLPFHQGSAWVLRWHVEPTQTPTVSAPDQKAAGPESCQAKSVDGGVSGEEG